MTSTRRLAAIMFTDLVGYSALTQRDEPLALELVNTKQRLISPLLEQHKGTLIKSLGDGLLIEFPSALQAVQCAMAIQGMLKGYNGSQSEDHQINVRIGIHLGDVEFKDVDVMGDGVNIASRIEPLADPGGICISGAIYDLVDGKLNARFDSLGKPELKHIQKEIEVFRVSPVEIPAKPVRQASKLDQRLKIGSVVAVGIIAIAAVWLMYQSLSAPPEIILEPGEITSIAVLPFTDRSENQDQEYFADGIAEELVNALAQVEDLRVPGSTSSFSFKGKDTSIKEIANQLGVQAILEGSVRKTGDRLRITAKFVRASDDTNLWAETFDREKGDIFEIQEEIAEAILIKLGYEIAPNERVVETGTDNIEAYNLFLRGQAFWEKQSSSDNQRAVELFEQAIELDPNFATARARLADAYIYNFSYGKLSRSEAYAKAQEQIDLALEIDVDNVDSLVMRAKVEGEYDRDYSSALASLEKALEINPKHAYAHELFGMLVFNIFGEREEGLQHLELAVQLNPLSPQLLHIQGEALLVEGKAEEAIKQYEKVLEFEPRNIGSYIKMAEAKQYLRDWAGADDAVNSLIEIDSDNPLIWMYNGFNDQYQDRFVEAEADYERAAQVRSDYSASEFNKGNVKALLYDWQGAKECLEQVLGLDESIPLGHTNLAYVLLILDEKSAALAEMDMAEDLAEEDALELSRLSRLNIMSGRFDEAAALDEQSLKINPLNQYSFHNLALIALLNNDYNSALSQLALARKYTFAFEKTLYLLIDAAEAYAFARSGQVELAQKTLDSILTSEKQPDVPYATAIAIIYMGLDRFEDALDWLEIAIEDHDPSMRYDFLQMGTLIPIHPIFEPLQDHPRFQEILRKMNLAD